MMGDIFCSAVTHLASSIFAIYNQYISIFDTESDYGNLLLVVEVLSGRRYR